MWREQELQGGGGRDAPGLMTTMAGALGTVYIVSAVQAKCVRHTLYEQAEEALVADHM